MQERNPYTPPQAPGENVGVNGSASAQELPFFAVSVFKLTLMSIFTVGLYQAYWFYKQWQHVRRREGHVSPFWRAVFGVFFCYGLFTRVRDYNRAGVVPRELAAGPLAAGWIVSSVFGQLLPEPYFWLGVLTVAFMLPVQARINEINRQCVPGHDRNDRLTALNWLGIVLGAVVYVLAYIGATMMPAGGPGTINV